MRAKFYIIFFISLTFWRHRGRSSNWRSRAYESESAAYHYEQVTLGSFHIENLVGRLVLYLDDDDEYYAQVPWDSWNFSAGRFKIGKSFSIICWQSSECMLNSIYSIRRFQYISILKYLVSKYHLRSGHSIDVQVPCLYQPSFMLDSFTTIGSTYSHIQQGLNGSNRTIEWWCPVII